MHQTASSQCRLVQTQTATQILIEIFRQSRQICCGYKYIGKDVIQSVHFDQNNPGVDIGIDLSKILNYLVRPSLYLS